MMAIHRGLAAAFAFGTALALGGLAQAQTTTLKWAHVYEPAEPYHTSSVWAAEEINKRTNGRYKIDVYPSSQLGKESDINQGLTLGTVDMIISGSSFAAKAYPPSASPIIPTPSAMRTTCWPIPRAMSSRNSPRAMRTRPAITSSP